MKNVIFSIVAGALVWTTFSLNSLNAAESEQGVSVQVIGSGGPYLNDNRASASYLIWIDGKAKIMVDAGGGSSLNFEESGANILDIDAILFTHFHEDHSAEFPVYVKALAINDREITLRVMGPAKNDTNEGTSEFVYNLFDPDKGIFKFTAKGVTHDQPAPVINGRVATKDILFKFDIMDVPLDKQIHSYPLSDSITVSAVQTEHAVLPAVAWRVDIGDKSVTFTGDMTNHYNTVTTLAKDSDLLIAHNTVPEPTTTGQYVIHMPPSEIAKIATEANVKKLVLSHRSPGVVALDPQSIELIQKSYHGPILIADDLDEYPL